MNTLQSNYAKHVRAVHGLERTEVPNIDREELTDLVAAVSDSLQPLLRGVARQKELDEAKVREAEIKAQIASTTGKEKYKARNSLYCCQEEIRRLELNTYGLQELKQRVTERVLPIARRLSTTLDLPPVETGGQWNLDVTKNVLRTAHYLLRNAS